MSSVDACGDILLNAIPGDRCCCCCSGCAPLKPPYMPRLPALGLGLGGLFTVGLTDLRVWMVLLTGLKALLLLLLPA